MSVRASSVPLAHRLLGAHVVRRAEGHAGLRHPGAGAGGGERDAEVGHQCAAVVQQDVLGLDVAVDDALAVGVVEGAGHLARNPHRIGDRQLLLAGQPVAKRLPLDVRHDVVEEAVGRPAVVQRQDVRVLQVGRGRNLGDEPLGADDGGQLGAQHLDGHLALVLEVLGQVHRGHAAGPELALDAVAVGKGRGEAFDGAAHRLTVPPWRAVRRGCSARRPGRPSRRPARSG